MQVQSHLPWFEPSMDPRWAEIVKAKGKGCLYKKGQVIVNEGDILHHAYYVAQGLACYQIYTLHGHARIVCIVGPSSFFGLAPVIRGTPLINNVCAMEDSLIYSLSKNDLQEIINKDKEMAYDVIVNLSFKVRAAYNLVGVLSLLKPEERIIYCVYAMIQSFKVVEKDGWYKLPLSLSHEQLGEMVGAHRVTVCRVINHWRKRELLDVKKNNMYVHSDLFTDARGIIPELQLEGLGRRPCPA